MGWTDERVEFLKAHWAAGESATHIARQLGGITRNAVLGKIHRLGLADRPSASKPDRLARTPAPRAATPRAPRPVTLRLAGNSTVFHEPATPRPPREIIPFKDEPPGRVTSLTLQPYQCKWPIGSPGDPDFTHCGAQALDGPYCDEHRARAYQPATKRKSSAYELARSLRRYL